MAKTTITGKRQITLPSEVCQALHLRQGDKLTVEVVGDEIRMKRVESPIFRPFRPDNPLFKVVGIGHGPSDLAENHDKYLAEDESK